MASVSHRDSLRQLFSLAGPVIVAEIGWMAMGIVDTIMVGPLGPTAIGTVGLGSIVFMAVAIFGMGLFLGLDTLVSQAFGAGRLAECHAWLVHSLALAVLLGVPGTVVLAHARPGLALLGLHRDVLLLTQPYVGAVVWSLVPLLFYAAFRRYLQGMSIVRPTVVALVTANVLNVVANWALIYGHLGLPALGVTGAAWATVVSRVYMALVLGAASVARLADFGVRARHAVRSFEWWRLGRLVGLGFPAASQITIEVGVFAAATTLAGRLDPVSLAAHQIALNVASLVFMVPLGVASAGAVLVGQAVGRRDAFGAARAGWTALGCMAAFMAAVAVVFVTLPEWLVAPFTTDPPVVLLSASLLLIAAIFQLFDGLQVVATGVLRGLGDTRTPMALNLLGHWGLGLPVGYALCFRRGWGVRGLWVGLSVGLISVGLILVVVWARRVKAWRATLSLSG